MEKRRVEAYHESQSADQQIQFLRQGEPVDTISRRSAPMLLTPAVELKMDVDLGWAASCPRGNLKIRAAGQAHSAMRRRERGRRQSTATWWSIRIWPDEAGTRCDSNPPGAMGRPRRYQKRQRRQASDS